MVHHEVHYRKYPIASGMPAPFDGWHEHLPEEIGLPCGDRERVWVRIRSYTIDPNSDSASRVVTRVMAFVKPEELEGK